MFKKSITLFFFCLLGLQVAALAAVNVINRSGSLKVTMPDKTEVVIKAGDPMPQLPKGAVLEMTQCNLPDKISADVVIDGQSIHLTCGSQLLLKTSGFDVLKGEVSVKPFVEPYTPPTVPDRLTDTRVQGEESSRDISPVRQ